MAAVEAKPIPSAVPPPVQPERVPEIAALPARPALPPLVVGSFEAAPTVPQSPVREQTLVAAAGFDTAPVQPSEKKLAASASPAGFDRASEPGTARAGARQAASVADAGFGGAPAAPPPRPAARTDVLEGAFDVQPAPVRPSASGADRERRVDGIDVPVVILSKPTPAYTDEARALRLEGDVVLEVEFCASSTVRVIRVVRGMGHGLDESATDAATQIRFRPALAGGRAVDFRTTVHIVFRLT